MASESVFEGLSNALAEAMRSALDGTNKMLPRLTPPDAAGARNALNQLGPKAQAVTAAPNPAAWLGALDQWRQTVRAIADRAFGPPNADEAMLVRILDERMPRTAAFLTLSGAIIRNPSGHDRVDNARLNQLLTDPGTAVNEGMWDGLLADLGGPGTGRLPAVLAGLAILAPQTALALARGNTKVAPLPAPPTNAPGDWRTFRDKTEGWVSITVPLGDPARPAPHPGGIFELVADLQPDLSATLGIRSQRRMVAGRRVTDFEMWLALAVAGNRWQLDLGNGWFIRVEPGINVGFGHDDQGWHGAFRQFPLGTAVPPGPGDPVVASLGRELPNGAPDLVLGPPYDTRLIIKDLGAYLKVREDHPIVEVGAFVKEFAVVLTNRWWRTFGISDTLFGEGIRVDLDLDIAYVEGTGLRLNLGAGLDVRFDLNKTIGSASSPVSFTLHSIRLTVPVKATEAQFDIRGEVRFHISLRSGPATMVVDGLGGWVGYWADNPGGPKKYAGFLPPTGAGLQIAAGPFVGGGFLDFTGGPDERFGGVVYIKFGAFEITAFGVHELTGRAGEPNRKTSFVLVLGVRFSPGIQLGFGIEISGFGGLVGINRRADTDALRERLTSGAAGNVLFAEDPIRNAPSILGDLRALFPPQAGTHVFGPTIQLSWLNIAGAKFLRLDIGLFFEFPGPSKVILMGSARAQIPPVQGVPKLLELRLDVVGFLDVPKKIIEFDATLIQSRALYGFHLTGDAAFRLHWGDPPYLMLTIGGFHPRFNPEPAVFPELTRLALTLETSLPGLFFRAEAYLAVTSNTVQFGGKVEIGYQAGPLNLVGFLSLDALIQFTPFHFEVTFSAGVRLRWKSTTLAGVRLEGTISGPGPFVVSGKACFEILWIDICREATIRLGPSGDPAPPPVGSVVQALKPEITKPENVSAVGGDDKQAVRQPRPTAGPRPVVSPLGAVQWTQHRAPFDVLLDRFEGAPLGAQQSVVASSPQKLGSVSDWFSPGSFANLTEAESLNRPGFQRCGAGLTIGYPVTASGSAGHDVKVQEIVLPSRAIDRTKNALAFAAVTMAGAAARSGAAAVRTTDAKVGVREEQFVVRGRDGSVLLAARNVFDAHQQARNLGGVAVHPADLVDIGAV